MNFEFSNCPSDIIQYFLTGPVTFEVQFMKKLSNTDVELKKSVAYKKSVYPERERERGKVKLNLIEKQTFRFD